MDTITVNTNSANSKNKKNGKIDPTTVAAGATTAIAGIALGATASSIANDIDQADQADEQVPVSHLAETEAAMVEEVEEEAISADDDLPEVNPDEVMLEEPIEAPQALASQAPQAPAAADDPYQPFALNDEIEAPNADEIIIADNTLADASDVDIIVGEPYADDIDVIINDDPLLADNTDYADTDIQMDLMA